MLTSGSLKERISIKSPTRTSNGSGGFTTVYNEVLSTYADVMELGVSNDLIAQQVDFIQPYQFKIRYRQDVIIDIGDKIDWRGRRFEITGFKGGFLNREWIKIVAKTENEDTSNGEGQT